jgi:phage baseplate assembly protein W
MIPNINSKLQQGFQIVEQPTKTYKLDIEKGTVVGHTDHLGAIKQAIHLILNTERFNYEIYSWNYGIELFGLIGEPKEYVYAELKRRITEALTQDERIESVDAFSFSTVKNEVAVTFTVHTKIGDIQAERRMKI